MAITKGLQHGCSNQGLNGSCQSSNQGQISDHTSQTQQSQDTSRKTQTSVQALQQSQNLNQRSQSHSQPLYQRVHNSSNKAQTPSKIIQYYQDLSQRSQTPTHTPQKVHNLRQRTPTQNSPQGLNLTETPPYVSLQRLNSNQTPIEISHKKFSLSQTLNNQSYRPRRTLVYKNVLQRPHKITNKIAPRKDGSCFSVFEAAMYYLNFYDLRNRTVPVLKPYSKTLKSNKIDKIEIPATDETSTIQNEELYQESDEIESPPFTDEMLWAQYGIYHRTETPQKGTLIGKLLHSLGYILFFVLLLLSYGFSCIFLHSHFYPPTASIPPLLQQDIHEHIERKFELRYLEDNSNTFKDIQNLEKNLNYLKHEISKSLNFKFEENQKNQNGVLEELLVADLACSAYSGSVLATPDTEPALVPYAITLFGLFTINIEKAYNTPDTTLQGMITQVGDCWAFVSKQGRLVLKLSRSSLVTGVSVSHITPSSSPTGDISSAPKHFQVLAHQAEDELDSGLLLGEFEYKNPGPWRQTFSLARGKEELYTIIEFRFLDNHGNANFTCIYRVHVHGTIPT